MVIEMAESTVDKTRYVRALQDYCKILIANAEDIVGEMNGLGDLDITIHIPCLNDGTDAPNISVSKDYYNRDTIWTWLTGEEVQNEN